MIEDVGQAARERLTRLAPASSDDVALAGEPIVALSADFQNALAELKRYMLQHVYRHEKVMTVMRRAESLVADLFQHYMKSDSGLPDRWVAAVAGRDDATRAALIGDFVAGMTDRYAIEAHQALFDHTPELR